MHILVNPLQMTIVVDQVNVYHGVSPKSNKPYTRYFMQCHDPLTGKEFKYSQFAKDEKKPPVAGAEYPLVTYLDRNNNFELISNTIIDEDIVS